MSQPGATYQNVSPSAASNPYQPSPSILDPKLPDERRRGNFFFFFLFSLPPKKLSVLSADRKIANGRERRTPAISIGPPHTPNWWSYALRPCSMGQFFSTGIRPGSGRWRIESLQSLV